MDAISQALRKEGQSFPCWGRLLNAAREMGENLPESCWLAILKTSMAQNVTLLSWQCRKEKLEKEDGRKWKETLKDGGARKRKNEGGKKGQPGSMEAWKQKTLIRFGWWVDEQ